ncbi:predicted protein [Arabidopsis lyrata subsp. lyrata]|uniref:Predicted protein n=1 Tax=Arabidopsis lyrata subsp. lyrata TaxID=81972 RepID=D7LX67_ARALL|nr:predicted protein [Arabidopsis lyrata subsp. lyrata]
MVKPRNLSVDRRRSRRSSLIWKMKKKLSQMLGDEASAVPQEMNIGGSKVEKSRRDYEDEEET